MEEKKKHRRNLFLFHTFLLFETLTAYIKARGFSRLSVIRRGNNQLEGDESF